jgi:hypothetical protein
MVRSCHSPRNDWPEHWCESTICTWNTDVLHSSYLFSNTPFQLDKPFPSDMMFSNLWTSLDTARCFNLRGGTSMVLSLSVRLVRRTICFAVDMPVTRITQARVCGQMCLRCTQKYHQLLICATHETTTKFRDATTELKTVAQSRNRNLNFIKYQIYVRLFSLSKARTHARTHTQCFGNLLYYSFLQDNGCQIFPSL